jgi:hypothetical protein
LSLQRVSCDDLARSFPLKFPLAATPSFRAKDLAMPLQIRRARLLLLAAFVVSLSFLGMLLKPSAALESSRDVIGPPARPAKTDPIPLPRDSVGLIPLTDVGSEFHYKGEDGGLYGGDSNEPPEGLLKAALEAAAQIQPLNARGVPAEDGKVVLVAVGMSNTTQEFRQFMKQARRDHAKAPEVVLVDGAQGGMVSSAWANPELPVSHGHANPWTVLDKHLKEEGGTAPQVQAAWIKLAIAHPGRLGEYPFHSNALRTDLEVIVEKLKARFPNLRLVYLSSRTYGGYASTALNPEPYAYESAFAVRSLILDRARANATEPVLLWGPYLWVDGLQARKADGLIWNRDDLAADGTHPSPSGQRKVADQLLAFFMNDRTTRAWFRRRSSN